MDIGPQLRDAIGDTPWLAAVEVAAALPNFVAQLESIGLSSNILGLCATPGVGEPHDVPVVYVDVSADSIMGSIRSFSKVVTALPASVTAAIDRWDPARAGRVLTAPFADTTSVAGRPVFGPRPSRYLELEDKMIADDLWQRAGIQRAPSLIVPADQAGLMAAADRLDRGLGTVWVGDNREGWHGGAEYLRWVVDANSGAEAAAWLSERCHRVRVMPFLDGIPCSIHGFVMPGGVAVFRPVEMLILRQAEPAGLLLGGLSTTWDPPSEVRTQMRDAAAAVGTELLHREAYRGAFGIDGIATGEGFLPTELNPRLSGGLGVQSRAAQLPIGMLNRAVAEGLEVDVDLEDLEETVVTAADRERTARSYVPIQHAVGEQRNIDVWVEAGRLEERGSGKPHGSVSVGPAVAGGLIQVEVEAAAIPTGSSFAPYVAHGVALADLRFQTGVGRVEAAPDVLKPTDRPREK